MFFCKKCKTLMRPKKQGEKTVMVCPRCGWITESLEKQDNVIKISLREKKETVVINEREEMKKMSTIEAECPKCGHNRAVWWLVQTRGVDEPATRFFRCAKCRYTWREYA